MLSKEVKDILEGVHFFLVEGLKSETLSGKVECLRRGLLLQLEALQTPYPSLHFTSSLEPNANIRQTSASLPFLGAEQRSVNSSRMSTSSCSSTNYSSTGGSNGSSTGYSGDGIVTAHNQNTTPMADKKMENEDEEFEDIETCSRNTTTTTLSRRSSASDIRRGESFDDKEDESYAEGVDPVSFRILVGNCDYHGVLSKRTKGLLLGMRNSKNFRCVLAGSLLYLYLKESDDKQKKVIDVSGYQVQEAPLDENKLNSRRRDFAFQLVGPGRKPHVFFTPKKVAMERWIARIEQAIASSPGGSRPTTLTKVEEGRRTLRGQEEDEEFDDYDEEFYEELQPEDESPGDRPPPLPQSSPCRPTVPPYQLTPAMHCNQGPDAASEYYSVPEDGEAPPPPPKPASNGHQKQPVPPKRPPLPKIFQRKFLQQSRPLPEAPKNDTEATGGGKATDDEIYCEIDDAVADTVPATVQENLKHDNVPDPVMNNFLNGSSFSKEIFDTINERVPSLPQRTYHKRWNEMSSRSNSSTETDTYDTPSDVAVPTSLPSWKIANLPSSTPSIPPKGSSVSQSDEESDYKIPSSSTYDDEGLYQVPCPNPVPVRPLFNQKLLDFSRQETKEAEKEQETPPESLNQATEEQINANLEREQINANLEREQINANLEREQIGANSTQEIANAIPEQEQLIQFSDHEQESDRAQLLQNQDESDSQISDSVNNNERKCKERKWSVGLKFRNTEIKDKSDADGGSENSNSSSADTEHKVGNQMVKINSSNSVKDMIAKLNQKDELTETSHHQSLGINSSFRKSKHSLTSTDKPTLVETRSKVEISKNIQSIQNCVEPKENSNLQTKIIMKETKPSLNGEILKPNNEAELPIPEDSPKDGVYQNCLLKKRSQKTTPDSSVFVAKFAHVSEVPQGLSFNRGDEIFVSEPSPDQRFWKAVLRGKEGLVPKEYLRRKE